MKEYLGKSEDQVRKIFEAKPEVERFADLMKVARMRPMDLNTGKPKDDGPVDLYQRVAIKTLSKIAAEQANRLTKNQ